MSRQLVGRAEELHQLRELAQQAREGQTKVVLLTGPPGIGKSALAAAGVQDLTPLRLHHREADASRQLGAVRHMLALADLDTSADSATSADPDPATNAETQTAPELAVTIATLLEHLDTPRAIIIEDVHWVDRASQEVLWHVVDRLDDQGTLIVVTSRDPNDWLTERLAQHVAFGQRGLHLRLGPLTPADVGQYVRLRLNVVPTAAQVTRIVTASGGSPLFLEALVTQLERSRRGHDSLGHAIDALTTEPLTESVNPDALGLSPQARSALLTLALGGPLTLEQLRRTAELLDAHPVPTDELAASGLLATSGLVFRHHQLAESFVGHFPRDLARAARRALAQVVGGLDALRHRVAAADDGTDATLLPELLQHMGAAAASRDMETAYLLAGWAADLNPAMLPWPASSPTAPVGPPNCSPTPTRCVRCCPARTARCSSAPSRSASPARRAPTSPTPPSSTAPTTRRCCCSATPTANSDADCRRRRPSSCRRCCSTSARRSTSVPPRNWTPTPPIAPPVSSRPSRRCCACGGSSAPTATSPAARSPSSAAWLLTSPTRPRPDRWRCGPSRSPRRSPATSPRTPTRAGGSTSCSPRTPPPPTTCR